MSVTAMREVRASTQQRGGVGRADGVPATLLGLPKEELPISGAAGEGGAGGGQRGVCGRRHSWLLS